ncbi:MAG TPA: PP2C family protein-serine/threonine phosphatase [Solirubrobacteraceae bacterium]|nr:PP2C family protein-serine/threonine phosphatase [Solirubrobacteraceae bacterium]
MIAHAAAALRRALPRGQELPPDAFETRHRVLLVALCLHLPALPLVAVAYGAGVAHAVLHPLPVLALLLLAWRLRARRARSTAAALGLLTCSAVLVHAMNGLIEAHFHFFIILTVLAVYEDWAPYGLALGYVVVHHGLVGLGLPYRVFDHPGAEQGVEAWRWAGLHGLFITFAVAASVALWKLNERSREAALTELGGRVQAEAVAEALARGLRPDAIPGVAGFELAARYEPGGGRVGGDWYDVIPLADGGLLLALGDVAGNGPSAAGLSARLRHILRAYAEDGASPAALLARLDRTVGDTVATAACLLLDAGRSQVTYAVAGQLPPLVRDADGGVRLLERARSMPLAGFDVPRTEAVEHLAPGSTIVLCSDGLVERRGESLELGLDRLSGAVEQLGGDPDVLAERLVDAVGARLGGDDIAMLAVRCLPVSERRFEHDDAVVAPS